MAKNAISTIAVNVQANTAGLEQGLERANKSVKRWAENVQKNKNLTAQMTQGMDSLVKKYISFNAALSAGNALLAYNKSLADLADKADNAGMSLREIQEIKIISEDVGTDLDTVVTALNKFNSALNDAALNGGESADKFRSIGLSISDLQKMGEGEKLVALSKYIKDAANESEAFGKVAELMGEKPTAKLRSFFREYKTGFEDMRIATDSQIRASDAFDKALEKSLGVTKKVALQSLSPVVGIPTFIEAAKGGDSIEALQAKKDALLLAQDAKGSIFGPVGPILELINATIDYKSQIEAVTKQIEKLKKESAEAAKTPAVPTGDGAATFAEFKSKIDAASKVPLLERIGGTTDDLFKNLNTMGLVGDPAAMAALKKFTEDNKKDVDALAASYIKLGQSEEETYQTQLKELDALKKLNPELASHYDAILSKINPATQLMEKYNDALAGVDEVEAYNQKIASIEKFTDELYNNATALKLSIEQIALLEEQMKKSASNALPINRFKEETLNKYKSKDDLMGEKSRQLNAAGFAADSDIYKKEMAALNIELNKLSANAEIAKDVMEQGAFGYSEYAEIRAKALEGANELALKTNMSAKEHTALIDKIKLKYSEWGKIGTAVRQTFEDNLTAMFMGAMTFKEAMKGVLQAVLQELIRVMVVQKIVGVIAGGLSAGYSKLTGTEAATSTIPGKATGGPVKAGALYQVNEKGQEFFIPSSNGTIVTNDRLRQAMGSIKQGGGGSVVINQTINVSTGVQSTVRAELNQYMPRIREETKAAVLESVQKGGAYAKMIRA